MASVWLEEIDRGLMELLKNTVRYKDASGNTQTPKVVVRSPENEFAVQQFPSISFFNYHQRFNRERMVQDVEILDREGATATIKSPVLTYDLAYQIDFWSEYQEDINDMTRSWSGNIPPRSLLKVFDTEGNERFCPMQLIEIANSDTAEDGERIFHRTYSYRIWAYLDERPNTEQKVVTSEHELVRRD